MKSLLVMAMVFGFASVANAGSDNSKILKQIGVTKTATHSSSALANLKLSETASVCLQPGETCYAEDSWACCSGLCINQACR